MFVDQPVLKPRQGDVRLDPDPGRQRRLLRRCQLPAPMTAIEVWPRIPGSVPPDQRLIDERDTDLEQRRRLPHRHATVNGIQNPVSQIL